MSFAAFLCDPRQQPVSEYLDSRAEPAPRTCAPAGDLDCDVAIVGAGYTGLSAALTLAGRGVDVRVFDAHHIGWGGSGRAWGQVTATAKFMPAKIEADFGPEVGARINAAAETGPDLVLGLIEKHGIVCDVRRSGNLIAPHAPANEPGIVNTVRDLQRRGLPVELLGEKATQLAIGSRRYRMALHDPRGIQLNPLGYARGLARAAIAAGAKVHEGQLVKGLSRAQGIWTLTTSAGPVRAPVVVLGVNAFADDALFPGLGREVMPVRAYQVVSEPLPADALEIVLPQRHSLNDTRKLFSGVRLWPGGRLQIGVDGPPFRADGRAMLASASKRIAMMYPFLKGLKWEYGWGGWVDMTQDEYTRLHELAPGLFSAHGFSGRGIAIGTLMGRDLATLAQGGSRDDLVHPLVPLKPYWYHPVHRFLISGLINLWRIRDATNDFLYGKGVTGPLPEGVEV
jgi:glycine/D-amino acid oxidase-like deaminating enzyme